MEDYQRLILAAENQIDDVLLKCRKAKIAVNRLVTTAKQQQQKAFILVEISNDCKSQLTDLQQRRHQIQRRRRRNNLAGDAVPPGNCSSPDEEDTRTVPTIVMYNDGCSSSSSSSMSSSSDGDEKNIANNSPIICSFDKFSKYHPAEQVA